MNFNDGFSNFFEPGGKFRRRQNYSIFETSKLFAARKTADELSVH